MDQAPAQFGEDSSILGTRNCCTRVGVIFLLQAILPISLIGFLFKKTNLRMLTMLNEPGAVIIPAQP
jgi:hypothetical protein